MGYTVVALKEKILDMYPEIVRHRVSLTLDFNSELNTYDVKLKKGSHALKTHIDKKDADECMDGVKCVHLGVQIGEFVKNFES
ncbi:MAG: sulfite reductase [Nitrospira bacterium SG8_35_4]|nr:MAG: sulfite reductase [Nitrospira bacterium SG8_35_4]